MIRLLLLGLVLAGVWYLYRMVTQQGGATKPAELPETTPGADAAQGGSPEADTAAEEMVECPVCRAYLPASATEGCGRPDCPIPALAASRAGEATREGTS